MLAQALVPFNVRFVFILINFALLNLATTTAQPSTTTEAGTTTTQPSTTSDSGTSSAQPSTTTQTGTTTTEGATTTTVGGSTTESTPSNCTDERYDYGKVLELSNLFYEAQRSGDLPEDNRVPWRGDSSLGDKGANGEDLTGGYHDGKLVINKEIQHSTNNF